MYWEDFSLKKKGKILVYELGGVAMNGFKGILISKSNITKYRIRDIAIENGGEIKAIDSIDSYKMILESDVYNMVIIDLDDYQNKEEVIAHLKQVNKMIPILGIIGKADRDSFLRLILAGLVECIIKPFEDELLVKKIRAITEKITQIKDKGNIEVLSHDIPKMVKIEVRKAYKGNYDLSFMIAILEKKNSKEVKLSESDIWQKMEFELFETDILIPYGNHGIFGILPFCDRKKAEIVSRKLSDFFLKLCEENQILEFDLNLFFVSYPEEYESDKQILELLQKKVEKNTEMD